MSKNKLTKQQEMMKQLIEQKKNKNGDSKVLRPDRSVKPKTSRLKINNNGGGVFDSK